MIIFSFFRKWNGNIIKRKPQYNNIINYLDELKEHILDYKLPKLGDVQVIEKKYLK
ncbi:hypothetical protein JFP55_pF0052 (plasmid) [Clostridium perfringens]|uniref:Uncharacterized protein n=1 Tax=Clostridium perfringens TaxID=1502 RepID=A0A140GQ39_CLOPF|nr:hypothetical protein JFP838_pC0066 [Clostridium perfringens]AMN30716.1 hypothetical protein JFP55_pF0052 [Clostridium perfringens]